MKTMVMKNLRLWMPIPLGRGVGVCGCDAGNLTLVVDVLSC